MSSFNPHGGLGCSIFFYLHTCFLFLCTLLPACFVFSSFWSLWPVFPHLCLVGPPHPRSCLSSINMGSILVFVWLLSCCSLLEFLVYSCLTFCAPSFWLWGLRLGHNLKNKSSVILTHLFWRYPGFLIFNFPNNNSWKVKLLSNILY